MALRQNVRNDLPGDKNLIDLHFVPVSLRRKMFHRVSNQRMTILTLFLGVRDWEGVTPAQALRFL